MAMLTTTDIQAIVAETKSIYQLVRGTENHQRSTTNLDEDENRQQPLIGGPADLVPIRHWIVLGSANYR